MAGRVTSTTFTEAGRSAKMTEQKLTQVSLAMVLTHLELLNEEDIEEFGDSPAEAPNWSHQSDRWKDDYYLSEENNAWDAIRRVAYDDARTMVACVKWDAKRNKALCSEYDANFALAIFKLPGPTLAACLGRKMVKHYFNSLIGKIWVDEPSWDRQSQDSIVAALMQMYRRRQVIPLPVGAHPHDFECMEDLDDEPR
jgi:hypothetical protein